ncbi:hypothetical protein CHS0354_026946 [Potamilus streckersoni]|uniref:Protein kinase domain-containing protein n=1 Tax=Potamilus streckersoni TaxID=2493646 RepID=A0AAE0SCQ1_9BIVA|nr:hypothetical protein CHS0354_026946 [Potamilus streckersoni]
MSLASLKEKLTKGKDHSSDESVTFDLTGQTQWLELIFSQGNRPEDWQKFINSVKEGAQFPDDITRYNFICDLYDKAFKEIKADDNRTNETYADLFIDYAKLKKKHIPDEALYILSQARAICRKLAVVHVESAEQERYQGNEGKAKKILEKALLFEAKPIEMIKEAQRRLKEGRHQLYSPKQSSLCLVGGKEVSAGIGNEHELNGKKEESLADRVKSSKANKDSDTEPFRQPQIVNSKPLLRSYHSTPDMGSVKKIVPSSGSDFFLKRRAADIGLPMRVKKLNMPFHMTDECEEEDDTQDNNTFDGFIPLDASQQSNRTYLSSQGTHTSGYMSMINTDTIPIEREDSSTLKQQDQIPDDKHVPHVRVEEVNENLPKPNIQKPEAEKNQNSRTYSVKRPCQIPLSSLDQLQIPQQLSSKMDPLDQQKVLGISTPSVNSLVAPLQIPATPNLANLKVMKVNGQSYSVLDVVGQGGSSKVYQVMDLNDSKKKLKAIKCVNLEHANQMIVEGYKNEIKLLKRLQYCDKVIKMYDYEYDAENNKLYVVMEAGNCDLAMFFRSQTKEGKRLSDNLIKFYWEIMLQAVQALHKEGIIHSDLKPANFLMVDGNLKLIDFGIAKALQQDKTSVILETQVGTLNYMSPEAIMDSCGGDPSNKGRPKIKIGVKSDVWSLGCILYNMVYGKTPFQHIRHDFAKLQAIINNDFAIDFPEVADMQVIDVMKKCLHRDPKQRPSIDELLFHPYLIGTKKEEAIEENKISHIHIEALISKLSDQSTLSPSSLMTIKKLKTVLNKIDNPNPISSLEMGDEAKDGASNLSQWQNMAASIDNKHNSENNSFRHVNLSQSGKSVKGPNTASIKQVRAPLQSLSIKDYQIPDGAK